MQFIDPIVVPVRASCPAVLDKVRMIRGELGMVMLQFLGIVRRPQGQG